MYDLQDKLEPYVEASKQLYKELVRWECLVILNIPSYHVAMCRE